MKVTKLKLLNVKGVRQLEIYANPVCNEVAGPNGAGKTSVLDSIVWAFCGKRAIDSKPLRDGAEKGEIVVETDTLIVKRRFRENGDTKLTVTAKDGGKLGQRELDGLFGRFSFDPLAFSRMNPAEQLTVLQSLAGEEFCQRLAALDQELAEALEERQLANREVNRIGQIPEVEPAEPVDVSTLTAELEVIDEHNRVQAERRRGLESIEEKRIAALANLQRIRNELTAAEATLENLNEQLEHAPQPEQDKDKSAVLQRLADAGAQNERAAAYRDYLDRVRGKTERAQEANAADEKVAQLREQREELRSMASLPVDGVTFGEAGLRVNGIPFDQLSSSERIRISARIGMSTAPELRVMFVKDGSLLDEKSFAELHALAEERDYQLWVETVGQGHGDAVILEAGEVASVPLGRVASF